MNYTYVHENNLKQVTTVKATEPATTEGTVKLVDEKIIEKIKPINMNLNNVYITYKGLDYFAFAIEKGKTFEIPLSIRNLPTDFYWDNESLNRLVAIQDKTKVKLEIINWKDVETVYCKITTYDQTGSFIINITDSKNEMKPLTLTINVIE